MEQMSPFLETLKSPNFPQSPLSSYRRVEIHGNPHDQRLPPVEISQTSASAGTDSKHVVCDSLFLLFLSNPTAAACTNLPNAAHSRSSPRDNNNHHRYYYEYQQTDHAVFPPVPL